MFLHRTTSVFHTRLNIPFCFSISASISDFHTACKFLGSRSGMDNIRIILGYGAWSVGIWFPTFRDNAVVSFEESKYPRRMHLFLEISTLENETATLSRNVVNQITSDAVSQPISFYSSFKWARNTRWDGGIARYTRTHYAVRKQAQIGVCDSSDVIHLHPLLSCRSWGLYISLQVGQLIFCV